MIPVKIGQRLFIRKGPGTGFGSLGITTPSGNVVNMEGKVTGEPYKNISDWYYFTNANGLKQYYWGGGVVESTNYNQLILGIPPEWKNTQGEEINVAILDTGCYAHNALKNAIVASYNAIDKDRNIDDTSDNSHGTFIAGLIAGRNANITGIAPKVNLIVVRVTKNDVGVTSNDVLEGLTWLNTRCPVKPHIVNISLDFDPFPNDDAFRQVFQQMHDKNIITICAGQNDAALATDHIFYPAVEQNVIGIGAIVTDCVLFANGGYKKINPAIKYVVPNIEYTSSGRLNTYISGKGCSFSTAVFSGITALLYSFLGNIDKPGDLLQALASNSNFLPASINNDLKLFKNENEAHPADTTGT